MGRLSRLESLKRYIIKYNNDYVSNLKEYVYAIAEVRDLMKKIKSESFMEWYRSEGMTKDDVSVLLKRHKLYTMYENRSEYISRLSDRDVKYMTKLTLPREELDQLMEDQSFNYEKLIRDPKLKSLDDMIDKLISQLDSISKSDLTSNHKAKLMLVSFTLKDLIS